MLTLGKDEAKIKEKMAQIDEKEKQFAKAIAKIDHAQVTNSFGESFHL